VSSKSLFCDRGCLSVGAPVGIVLGMVVTGFITDALGWQSSFYLFG